MTDNVPITLIRVSQSVAPICDRCESWRGLWDSDGNRLNYCGECGAKIDWGIVVDDDADDEEREPRDGELDPPDEPAAPREEYQAVGLALANELRALSVRCLSLATAVAEIDDEKLGGDGLRRMAAGLALDLAAWGNMKMPLKRSSRVHPIAYVAADYLAKHPAEWRLDNDGHLRDLLGAPIEVPPADVAALLATLRNTERDSRWKLDGAMREIAMLRRRMRKEAKGE